MCRYFKKISGVGKGECIYFQKSKSFSDGRTNSVQASNYSITPKLSYYGSKTRVKILTLTAEKSYSVDFAEYNEKLFKLILQSGKQLFIC